MMGNCDVCNEYSELIETIKVSTGQTRRSCALHINNKEDFRGIKE